MIVVWARAASSRAGLGCGHAASVDAHPGGQVSGRPPRTWKWTWKHRLARPPRRCWSRCGSRRGDALLLGDPGRRPSSRRPPAPASASASSCTSRRGAPRDRRARARAPGGAMSRKAMTAIVGVDDVGGDVAGGDRAEQAVAHGAHPSTPRRTAVGTTSDDAGATSTRLPQRIPADEVRSTVGPSRTMIAPAVVERPRVRRRVIPPSGPTTRTRSPRRAATADARATRAPPRAGRRARRPDRRDDASVRTCGSVDASRPTTGKRARRDCFAAARRRPPSDDATCSTRSPFQRVDAVRGGPRHDLVDADLGRAARRRVRRDRPWAAPARRSLAAPGRGSVGHGVDADTSRTSRRRWHTVPTTRRPTPSTSVDGSPTREPRDRDRVPRLRRRRRRTDVPAAAASTQAVGSTTNTGAVTWR